MAAQSGNTTMTSETPSEKPSKRSGDELKRACVDTVTPNREQLADLFALVLRLKTCMFTTRRVDGHLISRPMMLLEKHREVDLWFAANAESHKFDELEHDEHVNLAFVHQTTAGVTEWASIAGVAAIVKDREHVENLYWPEVKTWLKDCGDGVHDGGSDDPRLLLILVKIHCAAYQMQDRSTVNALLGMGECSKCNIAPAPILLQQRECLLGIPRTCPRSVRLSLL
ncbi:hypothetical protein BJ742DRAFT_841782 [Cladochytrium replicatum]|nr:hypothetical protein BJ742DRAFT_841782 [Cladochytrium replicatum]